MEPFQNHFENFSSLFFKNLGMAYKRREKFDLEEK